MPAALQNRQIRHVVCYARDAVRLRFRHRQAETFILACAEENIRLPENFLRILMISDVLHVLQPIHFRLVLESAAHDDQLCPRHAIANPHDRLDCIHRALFRRIAPHPEHCPPAQRVQRHIRNINRVPCLKHPRRKLPPVARIRRRQRHHAIRHRRHIRQALEAVVQFALEKRHRKDAVCVQQHLRTRRLNRQHIKENHRVSPRMVYHEVNLPRHLRQAPHMRAPALPVERVKRRNHHAPYALGQREILLVRLLRRNQRDFQPHFPPNVQQFRRHLLYPAAMHIVVIRGNAANRLVRQFLPPRLPDDARPQGHFHQLIHRQRLNDFLFRINPRDSFPRFLMIQPAAQHRRQPLQRMHRRPARDFHR